MELLIHEAWQALAVPGEARCVVVRWGAVEHGGIRQGPEWRGKEQLFMRGETWCAEVGLDMSRSGVVWRCEARQGEINALTNTENR